MPKAEKPCFAARLNYLTGRVRSLGAWAGLTVGERRHIEPFLENTAEMGDVSKPLSNAISVTFIFEVRSNAAE